MLLPATGLKADRWNEREAIRDAAGRFSRTRAEEAAGKVASIRSKITSMELSSIDGKLGGGNTSDVFKGTLEDGTPVVIKNRARVTPSRKRGYPDQDFERGLEHSQASSRIAEALGLRAPRCVVRDRDSLGSAGQVEVELRKRSDEDAPSVGKLSDSVEIQEMIPGFTPSNRVMSNGVEGVTISEDQAEAMQTFDYLVGATDRWNGNLAAHDGDLISMDHDRTFPMAKHPRGGGNLMRWVGPDGEPLAGKDISEGRLRILQKIGEDRDAWRKRLRADGLNDAEIDGFFARLDDVLEDGKVPEPTDLVKDSVTLRFGIYEAQYGVEGAGAPLVGEIKKSGIKENGKSRMNAPNVPDVPGEDDDDDGVGRPRAPKVVDPDLDPPPIPKPEGQDEVPFGLDIRELKVSGSSRSGRASSGARVPTSAVAASLARTR